MKFLTVKSYAIKHLRQITARNHQKPNNLAPGNRFMGGPPPYPNPSIRTIAIAFVVWFIPGFSR
jgi:hypothetical protein